MKKEDAGPLSGELSREAEKYRDIRREDLMLRITMTERCSIRDLALISGYSPSSVQRFIERARARRRALAIIAALP